MAALDSALEGTEMKKLILASSLVFLLAVVYTVASAGVVPGAVLILDAANNPADPDAWTNLGLAGGELSGGDNPPKLEVGTIDIPAFGIDVPNSKFYTNEVSGQCFIAEGGGVELFLEDWTIELLLRRNGDAFGESHTAGTHQLVGAITPPEGETQQGIRIVFWGASSQLGIWPYGPGWPNAAINVMLEKGEWNWVALSAEDKGKILVYQNGKQVSEHPGMDFDPNVPLNVITIGSTAPSDKDRNFNGSIAIVRISDRALSADEIMGNIRATLAVDPASKLTTTWGIVKTGH